ncbi:hypothetical protein SUGI_0922910 [Cryptomeria japonica]|nr:hypothetical protein SUGI_0922910 [Cryptomeria japonica]
MRPELQRCGVQEFRSAPHHYMVLDKAEPSTTTIQCGVPSNEKSILKKKKTQYMEDIRASEVAGFCVGGLLLVVALAVPKVDSFIANSQRSSLGICERCGGLKELERRIPLHHVKIVELKDVLIVPSVLDVD